MNLYFNNTTNIEKFDNQHFELYLKKNNIKFIPGEGLALNFYNLMASDYINGERSQIENSVNSDKDLHNIGKILQVYDKNKDILNKFNLLESSLILSKIFCSYKKCIGDIDAFNLGSIDGQTSFQELMDMDIDELFIYNQLGDCSAFKGKTKSLVRDTCGQISKYQHMEEYSELINSDILSHFLPNFEQKLYQKDLLVRAKYRYETKAENLIILVDSSGSMSDDIVKTRAILRKKLKQMRNTDRIFFSYFEMKIFGFREIQYNNIDKFLEEPIQANGGGTAVCGCIKSIMTDLLNNKIGDYSLSNTHFEVLVINDGQDSIDITYHPPIKVHTLSVEKENEALKTLCLRSGGSYKVL